MILGIANVQKRRVGSVTGSNTSLYSNVIPEVQTSINGENSQTGVSTCSVQKAAVTKNVIENKGICHWYALRTTYGREKKAYDYIVLHGVTAFLPTVFVEKTVKGKNRRIEVSRIPNVFFVYGTEETVKKFVYDNVNLPFLRFYYSQTIVGNKKEKVPMVVPDNQLNSFRIICEAKGEQDTLVLQENIVKFRKGERVRVVGGSFKGVTGIVARFRGQQRVGMVIDGLLTAVTAYIPSAFLVKIP